MKIPFFDLAPAAKDVEDSITQALERVRRSNFLILGPEVERFEADFASYCETSNCVGVSNGLDALFLILKGLGIGPGDEVIVPSNTFLASWLAVSHCGATPVPVEPNDSTYNIDTTKIEEAITGRTRAVIVVHLYGRVADMEPILQLADHYALAVIEDAAQAHGARYRGRRVGSLGTAAAFSFYPTKNLGALGDAGAITTNNGDLAARIRRLRNYGFQQRYVASEIGWNHRLDEIQAAVLSAKLPWLDRWNMSRRRVSSDYYKYLEGLEDIFLPVKALTDDHVWHLFVIRTKFRDRLESYLKNHGVDVLTHYPIPPHLQEAYAHAALKRKSFTKTERLSSEILSLPMYPYLSVQSVEFISTLIREFA